jgi:hypothetical protein
VPLQDYRQFSIATFTSSYASWLMMNGAIHSMFQVTNERIAPRDIVFSHSNPPARISVEIACFLAQIIVNQEQFHVWIFICSFCLENISNESLRCDRSWQCNWNWDIQRCIINLRFRFEQSLRLCWSLLCFLSLRPCPMWACKIYTARSLNEWLSWSSKKDLLH